MKIDHHLTIRVEKRYLIEEECKLDTQLIIGACQEGQKVFLLKEQPMSMPVGIAEAGGEVR
jgi:hypothetical protein